MFKPLNKNVWGEGGGGVPPGFTDLNKNFTDLSSDNIFGLAREARKKNWVFLEGVFKPLTKI